MEVKGHCSDTNEEPLPAASPEKIVFYQLELEEHCYSNPNGEAVSPMPSKKIGLYQCHVCSKIYNIRQSLHKHMKNKHSSYESPVTSAAYVKCREKDCSSTFPSTRQLRQHLELKHNLHFPEEHLEFKSEQEFVEWKANLEQYYHTSFIQKTGSKTRINYSVRYFYCKHSGKCSTARISNKRKIDEITESYCTASITVQKESETGKCLVTACNTHYGHHVDIHAIMRLSEAERKLATEYVNQNIPVLEMFDSLNNKFHSSTSQSYIMYRKFLRALEMEFGLYGAERDNDQVLSLGILIEEMSMLNNANPVLLYKPQGIPLSEGDCDITADDFVFIFQTNIQSEVMKKYTDGKIVCIDCIYGNKEHDLILITILISDSCDKAFPVAWCLSNRDDQGMLVLFFSTIREKLGTLSPSYFMSNDAEHYYAAWIEVFQEGPPHRLLCLWDVEQIWQKELLVSVNDYVSIVEIYKTLKYFLKESSVEKFEALVPQFLLILKENEYSKEYASFLEEYYLCDGRKELWAACYRQKIKIDASLYSSAFRRVVISVYFEAQLRKRLDFLVYVLLSVIHNEIYEQTLNQESFKSLSVNTDFFAPNEGSSDFDVQVLNTNTYLVKSSDDRMHYNVTFQNSCNSSCLLQSVHWDVCIHSAKCNCMHYMVLRITCKHIHHIAQLKKCNSRNETISKVEPVASLCTNNNISISEIDNPNEASTNLQKKVNGLVEDVKYLSDKCDTETTIDVIKHLNRVLNKMKKQFLK